jgi:hypothetical protein
VTADLWKREGEKPRLQVLFRLQVYASFEVINALRLYVEYALWVPLGIADEIFEVMTQVYHGLTNVSGFDSADSVISINDAN